MPETPFPSGNDPEAFEAKRFQIHMERVNSAHRNMAIAGLVVLAGLGAVVALLYQRSE